MLFQTAIGRLTPRQAFVVCDNEVYLYSPYLVYGVPGILSSIYIIYSTIYTK